MCDIIPLFSQQSHPSKPKFWLWAFQPFVILFPQLHIKQRKHVFFQKKQICRSDMRRFQPLEVTGQAMMATWHLASSCHLWQGLPTAPGLGIHAGPFSGLSVGDVEQARPGTGPEGPRLPAGTSQAFPPAPFGKTPPCKIINKHTNPTKGTLRPAPRLTRRPPLHRGHKVTADPVRTPPRRFPPPPARRTPRFAPAPPPMTSPLPLHWLQPPSGTRCPPRPRPLALPVSFPRCSRAIGASRWRSSAPLRSDWRGPARVAETGRRGAGASAVVRRRSAVARPGCGARGKRVLGGRRLCQGRAGSERDEAVSGWVRGAPARPGAARRPLCQGAKKDGGGRGPGPGPARGDPPRSGSRDAARTSLQRRAGPGREGSVRAPWCHLPPIPPPGGLGGGRVPAAAGPLRGPMAHPEGPPLTGTRPLPPAVGRLRPFWSPRACFPSPPPPPGFSLSPSSAPVRGLAHRFPSRVPSASRSVGRRWVFYRFYRPGSDDSSSQGFEQQQQPSAVPTAPCTPGCVKRG